MTEPLEAALQERIRMAEAGSEHRDFDRRSGWLLGLIGILLPAALIAMGWALTP